MEMDKSAIVALIKHLPSTFDLDCATARELIVVRACLGLVRRMGVCFSVWVWVWVDRRAGLCLG